MLNTACFPCTVDHAGMPGEYTLECRKALKGYNKTYMEARQNMDLYFSL